MTNERPRSSTGRNILIFRADLLSYSETFIPTQAERFQIFTPFYTGLRRIKGTTLPGDRVITATSSPRIASLEELASVFGFLAPGFVAAACNAHPELVHAHFEQDGIIAFPLAQRLKIPFFLTCQGYDVTQKGYRWDHRPTLGKYYQGRRRALFKQASVCFGVSRFICDQMLRRGYPPEKVRLMYTGVDTERFRPSESGIKKPMVLFVGRLVEKKGCCDLLLAMAKVAAKFPEVEVVIMGDGILRPELESLAREKKVNARFCGAQSPAIVNQAMQEALMLCAPSVQSKTGDCEGLPNVVFEAQSVGIPVVATRHAGIPEAVDHGVTGLLSAERDPIALAENILTLLSDTQLRSSMGNAARNRMAQHFELRQQSGLLEKTYLEFL